MVELTFWRIRHLRRVSRVAAGERSGIPVRVAVAVGDCRVVVRVPSALLKGRQRDEVAGAVVNGRGRVPPAPVDEPIQPASEVGARRIPRDEPRLQQRHVYEGV